MIRRWLSPFRRTAVREDGTATVEFVLSAPVVIFTFLAAFESGLHMVRYVMLDRALDITVRELRLGMIPTPALGILKQHVCAQAKLVSGCESSIKLELVPVDTNTWVFPQGRVDCVDRGGPIEPVVEPNLGVENQVMLIRACLTADALFPTTGIAAQMEQDSQGGYYIAAWSGFVNEP
jgi:hypothetical protein